MPHVLQPTQRERVRLTLNTDGRAHPVENAFAVATLVCGLVAFGATFFPGGHVIASWAGTLGFGIGLYSQYVSATTPQRSLNIVGLVASFVGAALGIARGGFLP
ncbi:hypothetical protein ACBI99_39335 [Nonomuraea sp. ATR24]|uniref:hypothetical protein n=1 Tax=Nonomuraea TaxID=83681 RepID=UPI001C5CE1E5|nr:hypothetical protein [Nonomuraea ceibae]